LLGDDAAAAEDDAAAAAGTEEVFDVAGADVEAVTEGLIVRVERIAGVDSAALGPSVHPAAFRRLEKDAARMSLKMTGRPIEMRIERPTEMRTGPKQYCLKRSPKRP